jgi:site-specific DNA recombinase
MLVQNTQAQMHELLYMIENTDLSLKEYREDVFKAVIDKVEVLSADHIWITFKGNTKMEQESPSE